MSYFRWLCAMHYAKLARHGNAFAETVNAFRLHRQQKTLACEAAAKARAEFWSRLTENVRKLRNGEVNTLRSPLQTRRLNHEQQSEAIEQETDAAYVASAGNFRATAKKVIARIFRGEEKNATIPLQTTTLSPLPGSSHRQTAESSLGKLWQQTRRLNHEQQSEAIEQETGAAYVASAGNFRATAKKVISRIFHGEEKNATLPLQTTTLSPLPGSSHRQTAESSLGKLWQQQKQTNEPVQQQQKQYQLTAQSSVEKCATAPQKSLAMFALPRSRAWSEGKSPSDIQQFALQTNQKATATTNKPPHESAVLVCPAACFQPQCKAAIRCADSTTPVTQQYAHESTEKQKAMLLPERPNILVLPELKVTEVLPKQHAPYCEEMFKANNDSQQMLKLLPTTPVNILRTHSNCKISMAPEECVLPPETDSPMTLLITNVLDKYKVISLPAGQAIPGNPKRHVQIKVKRDQNSNQVCSALQVKGRKI